MDDRIKEGDFVLIYFNEKRRYLIRVGKTSYNFNEGIVKSSDIIGKDYGSKGTTHLGEEYVLIKPSIIDIIYKGFKRKTQVIYPKDAALIILKTGIGPGYRVVEAGAGSGYLTALLAYHVRPNGKVYAYDIRRDFINLAAENLAKAGLSSYVIFKERDIREGIDEREIDAAILDLPSPWLALSNAFKALRHGGTLACFIPTINQVEKTVEKAFEEGFVAVETIELMERSYKVKSGETRPFQRMIGHTGYMVFARKP